MDIYFSILGLGSLVALVIGLLSLKFAEKLPAKYFDTAKYLPLGLLAYNKNLFLKYTPSEEE